MLKSVEKINEIFRIGIYSKYIFDGGK